MSTTPKTGGSPAHAGRRRSRRCPRRAAEASPRTTVATPASSRPLRRRPSTGGGAVVDGGRTRQLDDRVGDAVVAIRRRQVDDLEVVGDAAEQLERPGRPRVVEGDERVVEDERRPPVTGDEPDEPEPGGQVDEVERALAQRR